MYTNRWLAPYILISRKAQLNGLINSWPQQVAEFNFVRAYFRISGGTEVERSRQYAPLEYCKGQVTFGNKALHVLSVYWNKVPAGLVAIQLCVESFLRSSRNSVALILGGWIYHVEEREQSTPRQAAKIN